MAKAMKIDFGLPPRIRKGSAARIPGTTLS